MNINGHLKYGAVASAATTASSLFFFGVVSSIGLGLSVIVGSLVPDIDTHSTPSKWTARILSVVIIFTLSQELIATYIYDIGYRLIPTFTLYLCLIFTVIKSSKHRGFTHKYALPCALGAIGVFFNQYLIVAFALGLVVHYLCDSMNPLKYRNWV